MFKTTVFTFGKQHDQIIFISGSKCCCEPIVSGVHYPGDHLSTQDAHHLPAEQGQEAQATRRRRIGS